MEFVENITMYHLVCYFIIYSFMGWIVESTFKSILFKKPINSGFLHRSFYPYIWSRSSPYYNLSISVYKQRFPTIYIRIHIYDYYGIYCRDVYGENV